MLTYKQLTTRDLIQSTSATNSTQTRQTLLTALHPLSQYPLFLNSVTDEYPDLRDLYLQKIKYPTSLKEIRSKLQPRTLKYKVVGEVLRDLVLLVENCREFNSDNDQLLLAAEQFQDAIQTQLNEFCKKVNAESVDFKVLKQQIFSEFEPFPVPPQAKLPLEADFNTFKNLFGKLKPEQQGRILSILVDEMDEFEGGEFILEFNEDNGKIFWWVFGQVEEMLKEVEEEDEGEEEDNEEQTETGNDVVLPLNEI